MMFKFRKIFAIINDWLVQWTSPKWFYPRAKRWKFYLGLLAIILLTIGLFIGLTIAPADYLQGNSYRIIFIHVPSAALAQSSYIFLAIAGFIYLIWRVKLAAIFIIESVSVGMWFAVLTLITGAIWGKPTWGTYWFWDARIASATILVFLFLSIIAVFNSIKNTEQATKIASVVAIIGSINIPIIKYSVVWWNNLHQGDTFSLMTKAKMPIEMWLPLLIAVLGIYCFYGFIVLKRMISYQ